MDRNIFSYHDGKQDRTADPVRILRLLAVHSSGNLAALVDLAKSDNPEQAFPATDRLLAASRAAFGIQAFEQGGPNEDFPLAVLDQFFAFLEKKNLTPAKMPTSPAPIPATSPPSGAPARPISTSSSACG